jgi:hypothetical protein
MPPNAFCEVAVYDTVTVRLSPLSVTTTLRLFELYQWPYWGFPSCGHPRLLETGREHRA